MYLWPVGMVGGVYTAIDKSWDSNLNFNFKKIEIASRPNNIFLKIKIARRQRQTFREYHGNKENLYVIVYTNPLYFSKSS